MQKSILLPVIGLAALAGGLLVAIGSGPGAGGGIAGRGTLEASPTDPMADLDGDLLPDALEWILGTDPTRASSRDGVHDFVRAVLVAEHQLQRPTSNLDHAFRVLMTSSGRADGESAPRELHLHLLYRVASGRIQDVDGLRIFVDVAGSRLDASEVILPMVREVRSLDLGPEGLLVRASFKITATESVLSLLPMTFGAYSRVGGLWLASGTIVDAFGGALVALMPFGTYSYHWQPLDEGEVVNNHFWNRDRLCLFDLEVEGSVAGGQICQIIGADCVPAERFHCVTDCRSSNGGLIFVPDGLSLIRGG